MPWKDPESAEEGAEEGACTACWVSEGTGYRGPETRREEGSARCLLLLSCDCSVIVQVLGTFTSSHIDSFSIYSRSVY